MANLPINPNSNSNSTPQIRNVIPDDIDNVLNFGSNDNFNMEGSGWVNREGPIESPGYLLLKAIERGNLDEIQRIIKSGLNINRLIYTTNNPESSPLHFTVKRNYIDMSLYLISIGADPLLKDQNQMTPIDYAVTMENIPMLRILINTPDASGNTLGDRIELSKEGKNRKTREQIIEEHDKYLNICNRFNITMEYNHPKAAPPPVLAPRSSARREVIQIYRLKEKKLPLLTKSTKLPALEQAFARDAADRVLNLSLSRLQQLGIDPDQVTGQFLKSRIKRYFSNKITTLDLSEQNITSDLAAYLAKSLKTKLSSSLTDLHLTLPNMSISSLAKINNLLSSPEIRGRNIPITLLM